MRLRAAGGDLRHGVDSNVRLLRSLRGCAVEVVKVGVEGRSAGLPVPSGPVVCN